MSYNDNESIIVVRNKKKGSATETEENRNTINLKAKEGYKSGISEPKRDVPLKHASNERKFTRRTLAKKGWEVPVIMSAQIPMKK